MNNILLIGDIMVDKYTYGTCNRLSPEYPTPILEYTNNQLVLGGAGNVLNNFIGLDITPYLITDFNETDYYRNIY